MRFKFLLFLSLFITTLSWADMSPEQVLQKDLKKILKSQRFSLHKMENIENPKANGDFYEITPVNKMDIRYIYIGRVNVVRGRQQAEESKVDYLEYYILYKENKSINKVKIYNYQSNYGEAISAPSWLKGYEGYDSKKTLEVGTQLDAISGATLSINKLTFDIKQKTRILSSAE